MAANDYLPSVETFLQDREWATSTTDITPGVTMVAGIRTVSGQQSRMLTMVVEQPADEVSRKHVEFLLDAASNKDVDVCQLTTTVDMTEEVRPMCDEHDIDILDPETVAGSDGFDTAAGDVSMPPSTGPENQSTDPAETSPASEEPSHGQPTEQQPQGQQGRQPPHGQPPEQPPQGQQGRQPPHGQPAEQPPRGQQGRQPPHGQPAEQPPQGRPPEQPPQGQQGRQPLQTQQGGHPPRGGPVGAGGQPPEDGGTSRRKLLVAGGGVAIAGVGGFLIWDTFFSAGPKATAKEFYNAADAGNTGRIRDLLHPESPLRDSVSSLSQFERADLSVDSTELVEESEREGEDWAIVEVTTTISVRGESNRVEERVILRKGDGEWKVWGLRGENSGFLQTESEATGQQSSEQVTDRLEVTTATGTVDQSATEVTDVKVTVAKAPGAQNIDLTAVRVSWVESDGTFKLVHDGVDSTATGADGRFAIAPVTDQDDSAPVLNDPDDRLTMVFDLGTEAFSTDRSLFDTDAGTAGFADALGEGEIVTVKLTTSSGSTTNTRLVVPQSLSGADAVTLS